MRKVNDLTLTEILNLAEETKVRGYQQFPNHWRFFTSGYMVGLLIMVRIFLTFWNPQPSGVD